MSERTICWNFLFSRIPELISLYVRSPEFFFRNLLYPGEYKRLTFDAVGSSETAVTTYKTTQYRNAKDKILKMYI